MCRPYPARQSLSPCEFCLISTIFFFFFSTHRNKFKALLPNCHMENLYSISECHDISFCNLDELNTTESPKYAPCGKVVPNVRAYILDDQLEQVRAAGGVSLLFPNALISTGTLWPPFQLSLFCSKSIRSTMYHCSNFSSPLGTCVGV